MLRFHFVLTLEMQNFYTLGLGTYSANVHADLMGDAKKEGHCPAP